MRNRNNTNSSQLIKLYQQMSEHTLPKCKKCRVPLSCCSSGYCEMTIKYAHDEYGIELIRTSHNNLPMMGKNGCIVPPYLRPWCTMHVCCISALGFDANDSEWTEKYFDLRDLITEEDYKRGS